MLINLIYTPILAEENYGYIEPPYKLPYVDSTNVTDYNNPDFNDIEDGIWYEEAVNSAVKRGFFLDIHENKFEPNKEVTREEFAYVLFKLSGEDTVKIKNRVEFLDVEEGNKYNQYIGWVIDQDISQGVSKELFAPKKSLTRQEAAVLIYRLIQNMDISIGQRENSKMKFIDDEVISTWAKDEVDYIARIGLIKGNEKGEFLPDQPISRVDLAVIINNFLQLV